MTTAVAEPVKGRKGLKGRKKAADKKVAERRAKHAVRGAVVEYMSKHVDEWLAGADIFAAVEKSITKEMALGKADEIAAKNPAKNPGPPVPVWKRVEKGKRSLVSRALSDLVYRTAKPGEHTPKSPDSHLPLVEDTRPEKEKKRKKGKKPAEKVERSQFFDVKFRLTGFYRRKEYGGDLVLSKKG